MLGVDLHTQLTDEQRDSLLDSLSRQVVQRRLEVPAVLFLELHKPLSFIAGQSLLVGLPFLGAIFGAQNVADVSKMLADRENIDRLISRIEDMSAQPQITTETTASVQE